MGFATFAIWVSISLTLGAAEPKPSSEPEQALSYEQAVHVALSDNVDLLALRAQQESLSHQAAQALAPNEPTIGISKIDALKLALDSPAAERTTSVNWTIGFPGKAWTASSALRRQADSLREQAANQEITIMTALANNYVSFVVDQAFYKFLLNEQQKYADLVKLIEKKFQTGQAATIDVLNAKVATEQINLAVLENRNDYDIQLTTFRQLIRRPADKSLVPLIPEHIQIPEISQSLDELSTIMFRHNHLVRAAERTMDSQEQSLKNAALQFFPDFQLNVGVNTWDQIAAAPNPGTARDYTFGIALVIPLFSAFNEYRGLQSARKNVEASRYQLSSQQLQAVAALQTAYTSLKATLKDITLSEKLVVPATKQSFDFTLITYGLGKADYFVLNQARQAWHDAERDLLTKRQAAAGFFNQIIAQLGCDITKVSGPYACTP